MADTAAERLQARRTLLALIRRRQRPGTGSSAVALMQTEATRMRWWDDVDAALGTIPHAVVGAVAANRYMPPRQTADLDIAVRSNDLGTAEAALARAGWTRLGELRLAGGLAGSAWRHLLGNEAVLVGVPDELGRELIAAARPDAGSRLPFAALEHVVMLKLIASRGRDIGDLTSMLGLASEARLQPVRAVVRAHGSPEDAVDLEQLIAQGRLEHAAEGTP